MAKQDSPLRPLDERARLVLGKVLTVRIALVMHALADGKPKRFSALQRAIPSLSAKLLTQVVRSLEADGLVHREVFREVPPRVEYSLTPLGRSLKKPLATLCDWARDHTDELLGGPRARAR